MEIQLTIKMIHTLSLVGKVISITPKVVIPVLAARRTETILQNIGRPENTTFGLPTVRPRQIAVRTVLTPQGGT